MKRYLIIIIIITSFSLSGLDHGLITGFEVGYNIESTKLISSVNSDNVFFDNSKSFNIKMTTGYRINNIRLLGVYSNTLFFIGDSKFNPIQDNYKIELNYTLKDFKFGVYHYCDHPVITQEDKRTVLLNSGETSIYIQYYKEF